MVSLHTWASLLVTATAAVALTIPVSNPRIVLPNGAFPNKVLSVVSDSKCGPIGATINSTTITGPNGSQKWLSCGLNTTGGWDPPIFTVHDVIAKDLETAVKMPNSPFVRCQPYFPYFYKYGKMYDVPPILIASFANQESGCNPSLNGGAGEIGMMQITPDKCGAAPNGNCFDVEYNIQTATAYFAGQLQANKGSLLHAMGAYNGWYPTMTVQAATAAANTPCCHCQQNLDYIHQMCNGWMQGIDVYATGMGSYFNLAVCDRPTTSSAAPTPVSTPAPPASTSAPLPSTSAPPTSTSAPSAPAPTP